MSSSGLVQTISDADSVGEGIIKLCRLGHTFPPQGIDGVCQLTSPRCIGGLM